MRLVAIIRQYVVENAHRKHIQPLAEARNNANPEISN